MTNNAYRKTYLAVLSTYLLFYTCSQIIIKVKAHKEKTLKLTEMVVLGWHHAVTDVTVTSRWVLGRTMNGMKEELKRQWCNGKKRFIKNKTKREPSRALTESCHKAAEPASETPPQIKTKKTVNRPNTFQSNWRGTILPLTRAKGRNLSFMSEKLHSANSWTLTRMAVWRQRESRRLLPLCFYLEGDDESTCAHSAIGSCNLTGSGGGGREREQYKSIHITPTHKFKHLVFVKHVALWHHNTQNLQPPTTHPVGRLSWHTYSW